MDPVCDIIRNNALDYFVHFGSTAFGVIITKNRGYKIFFKPEKHEIEMLQKLAKFSGVVQLITIHQCKNIRSLFPDCSPYQTKLFPLDRYIRSLCQLKEIRPHGPFWIAEMEKLLFSTKAYMRFYLREYPIIPMIRRFIFLVILTLANIHDAYPKFQHGDLHIDNVMTRSSQETIFRFRNQSFHVPLDEQKTIPVILDFGLSNMSSRTQKNDLFRFIWDLLSYLENKIELRAYFYQVIEIVQDIIPGSMPALFYEIDPPDIEDYPDLLAECMSPIEILTTPTLFPEYRQAL